MSKSRRKNIVTDPGKEVESPDKARPVAAAQPVKKPGRQTGKSAAVRDKKTTTETAPAFVPEQSSAPPDSDREPAVDNSSSEIVNHQPEIDATMEVHHHPQLDHKPRPFKEYLLEGFMIFIAVMMGFIAENIREYIDNNEQVHQLTSQLAQDLKTDTSQLNAIYGEESHILKSNDSLFAIAQQPLAKIDTRKLQKLAIDSHSLWLFHPSGGAIGAIKNQLHLKQFSNSNIIGFIARYETHIELVRTVQDISLQYQRTYLDPFLRMHFTPGNLAIAFKRKPTNTQMRDLTQNDLTQLAIDMAFIRINTYELLQDNRKLKTDAVALLNYVKQEYGADK